MSLDQIRLEQWQKDDTLFVETRASIEVEKLIQSQNIAIVTGNPGSGKTAIVQHIALKYRSQGWTVKPVDAAKDTIEVLSKHTLEKRTIVVLNDPIGKETLDQLEYSSWKKQEENLQACLTKVKLLVSCRIYILNDNRVKGILKSKSNIIDISSKQLQLSKTEKKNIWQVYASNENVSKDELEKIVQSEAYFPLLCKLYFANKIKMKDRLKFFTEPIEVFEEEIRDFRTLCKERYCSLVLLVLFNNELCIEDMLEGETSRKKYKNALKLCDMKKNTAPHTISDTLKTLQGFFVKKIGDNFQFYHDFVMEVTTYVFGTDYPNDTIQYADIGFLRKRVRIEHDKRDQFTIYLSDKYIYALGKRLFNDIFGERLLDVVLNPCLNSEKVSQAFIEEMKRHPKKLNLLLEKKQNQIDSIDLNQISDNLLLSKLDFFSLEERISPLNAIIIFCNTNLSFYCLKALQNNTDNLKCNSIFSALCCQGSEELLTKFLKDNLQAYLSAKWNVFSPIHIAAAFHNFEILTELLQTGVDVNLKTDNDKYLTPLTLAAGNYTEDKEDERLLNNGAYIDFCTEEGASPLYAACEKGNYITVELLLSNKTNIDLCFKDGASPLFIACQEEHYNTVQLIDKAYVNLCKKNGASPLFIACQNGQEPIAKLLLSHGADLTLCLENGTSPLFVALQYGHANIVNLLQTYGADINQSITNDNGPLHIACQAGNDSMVQNILLGGASINSCLKDGASPLYIASANGHDNIVKILISNEANINLCKDNGVSPLHIACQKGHDGVVHKLLSSKAKINACTQDGSSPLHVACKYGHTDVVKLLLNNGGNINSIKKNGSSPLFVACQNGKISIVQLLLNEGADINLCTRNRVSPLYIACREGHESIVQLLIDNKAEINLCKKNRTSPLWIAFKKGHHTIGRELIRNGAK
uniref:Novel STAND NTPase 3 domain-containing protein n=1 Tax=Magallana gigas TaxID=29159 RepID=A0A8W8NNY9_MAGGI